VSGSWPPRTRRITRLRPARSSRSDKRCHSCRACPPVMGRRKSRSTRCSLVRCHNFEARAAAVRDKASPRWRCTPCRRPADFRAGSPSTPGPARGMSPDRRRPARSSSRALPFHTRRWRIAPGTELAIPAPRPSPSSSSSRRHPAQPAARRSLRRVASGPALVASES